MEAAYFCESNRIDVTHSTSFVIGIILVDQNCSSGQRNYLLTRLVCSEFRSGPPDLLERQKLSFDGMEEISSRSVLIDYASPLNSQM
jgi:hypothetical protein